MLFYYSNVGVGISQNNIVSEYCYSNDFIKQNVLHKRNVHTFMYFPWCLLVCFYVQYLNYIYVIITGFMVLGISQFKVAVQLSLL